MKFCDLYLLNRRSPHGERGLKFEPIGKVNTYDGRSPHGERGLKLVMNPQKCLYAKGRSPHGERGLK